MAKQAKQDLEHSEISQYHRATAQVHVKLSHPIKIRKFLLESAISSARLHQCFTRYKQLRKHKIEQQRIFRDKILEVHELFTKIRHIIPDLEEEQLEREHQKKAQQMQKPEHKFSAETTETIKTKEKTQHPETEFQKPVKKDAFEMEIDEIRKKLESLEI